MTLNIFHAGDGINAIKLNENFAEVQDQVNDNELAINDIDQNALRVDGSNMTQSMVNDFQRQTPIVLSGDGDISLTDNSVHFLTLTGNARVVLPSTPISDIYSHTIILVVAGHSYTFDYANNTTGHLYNNLDIDPTKTYSIMYIYNKIDNNWYYSITQ